MRGNIIEDQTNSRLWTLADRIPWIGNVTTFYNRECYDTIALNIFNNKLTHVLIFGTPGIGKTMFLQRLPVELVRCARSKGEEPPSIHYQRRFAGGVQTLSFLRDGSVEDVTGHKHDTYPAFLFSDSVDLDPPYGTVLNLEVASDKEGNYSIFKKRIGESEAGAEIVMPLFSFDELLRIKSAAIDAEVAEFLYDIFGGSARNFVYSSSLESAILPVVEETLGLMFPDINSDSPLFVWFGKVAQHVSSKLLTDVAQETGPSTVNSMMRHRLVNRTTIWASRFMEFLAAAIADDKASNVSGALKQIISAAGMGCLFEALGHRKLLSSTTDFLLKPLQQSMPLDRPMFESAKFKLDVVRFKTIAEIGNLCIGTYGLPMNNNFPLIDAVIQPDTFIQFTVSLTHKGAVDNLEAMRALLKEKDRSKHRIIFVVPQENALKFKFQSNLCAIRQFVCIGDPSAIDEESLMTDVEKRRWVSQDTKRQSSTLDPTSSPSSKRPATAP